MAILINGKACAEYLRADIATKTRDLIASGAPQPGLAVVIIGEDPASQIYVRNKVRQTKAVGMRSIEHILPESTDQKTLLALIDSLNHDQGVHGILVQLPLPGHIDADAVINAVNPLKDVDGFHILNAGRLFIGQKTFVPCTPLGCLMLIKHYGGDLTGKHAVVLGRSNIVGKPMAHLLLRENCTVTIAHSRTPDPAAICRQADILVAAVGQPELVRKDWVKPGAIVIDVGINRIPPPHEGEKPRLVGDVAFSEVASSAAAISPVPGGVGPMTIACLLANTLTAALRSHGLGDPHFSLGEKTFPLEKVEI